MEISGRPPLEQNRSSVSGNSLYYDAPLAHFHMAQNPDLPIVNGKEQASLNREPTVAGGATKTRINSNSPPPAKEIVEDDGDPEFTDEPDQNDITAHPNGSEGWLPATDLPPPERVMSPSSQPVRSGSVLKKRRPGSIASSVRGSGVERSRSTRSVGSTRSRRSMFTDVEGRPVNGSTFINGAGTTGPSATAVPIDDSLHRRMQTADSVLSGKQKKKIGKVEVIKQESKVEKQSLDVAIRELGELQKLQKAAVKREAKAHTAHTKALTAFQKAEEVYLAARTKYEVAQAAMQAESEILEIARNNARSATENMQEKATEVDGLRKVFGVDEREREVMLTDLKGKSKDKEIGKERKGSGFWR
ncbi:hypothetical protein GYMLUDRAFT_471361 [Collybiopsis luxurians FD-317 M1]|uniref:DNA binding protein Ncp1 n=1 Tax=Collybiopsis luxurians FD-317 M1 TaxID=944289 RepID=A0A0D0BGC1_9AGAR|nr:hypothetical protein GYMLUDRAFT_471361 [Collybiopsis luxurians FD-317 M1]